jgi:hypothetical protein
MSQADRELAEKMSQADEAPPLSRADDTSDGPSRASRPSAALASSGCSLSALQGLRAARRHRPGRRPAGDRGRLPPEPRPSQGTSRSCSTCSARSRSPRRSQPEAPAVRISRRACPRRSLTAWWATPTRAGAPGLAQPAGLAGCQTRVHTLECFGESLRVRWRLGHGPDDGAAHRFVA